jgi:SAM-dependent methyltransferase
MIPFKLHRRIPFVRRPFYQRDLAIAERNRFALERESLSSERSLLIAERDALLAERDILRARSVEIGIFRDRNPAVLQYRQAYYEAHGHIAPGSALPSARDFPHCGSGLSYKQKLTGLLDTAGGHGAEIGPLDIPLLSKQEARVLYLDHLDTDGLRKKYPTLPNIVEVDRPMVNNSIVDTLRSDGPLDYVVASQVFEHVPNPIGWLREVADVLRTGGLLALSLPDRRMTFDFMREESRASDLLSAYLHDSVVPDVRSVYDHHSQASFINMHWATPLSLTPEEVMVGYGAVRPKLATDDYMSYTREAKEGSYFDVHAWVYTPPSFLIIMAQLAQDELIPFRCHQFYPTDEASGDRDSSSFTIVLEKVSEPFDLADLRRSFLMPLGEM